ncbi:MAG: hypothetical protein ACPHCI_02080 [Solirubrobacterales bacterium]
MTLSWRTSLTLAVLACAALTVPVLLLSSTADAATARDSVRTTFLFSRSLSGGIPNGPSRHGTVSHDQRIARVAAYESDASNIVEGDTNGVTDVFMVRRAAPWGRNGTPWSMGPTQLVSKGMGGAPANGRSYAPELDGSSHNAPRCIGFISEASNLVPGDTNEAADAFVYDLKRNKITRVSVNSAGRQANGPSFDVSVDGDCERVAFTSTATNLALKKVVKTSWRTAKSSGGTGGHKQVYVHVRSGKGHDRGFKRMTFLASASKSGRPGNGDSFEPYFAGSGKAVVFTSAARNLARGDRSSNADVYIRTFVRKYTRYRGKGHQMLKFDTRLVSANRSGRAGNGPSTQPTTTDDARWVSFKTDATNLLPGDRNSVSDIARADLKKKRVKLNWVSKGIEGIGNGASNNPVMSNAGEFVLFDSDATNFRPSYSVIPDPNGVRDMFLWNAPTKNVSLESRNWDNKYLTTSSSNPKTSSRGNYVLFESADQSIDQLLRNYTGVPQVYMRYLGPQ